jgi:hypothetical protein
LQVGIELVAILEKFSSCELSFIVLGVLLLTVNSVRILEHQFGDFKDDCEIELGDRLEEGDDLAVDYFETVEFKLLDEILLEFWNINVLEANEDVVFEGTEDVDHASLDLIELLARFLVAEEDESNDLRLLD